MYVRGQGSENLDLLLGVGDSDAPPAAAANRDGRLDRQLDRRRRATRVGPAPPGNHRYMTTIAVLGTGTMGAGMARSLLREGFGVRAWNRTAGKAAPLSADGAVVTASAADAVAGADVVLVMLFDLDAVVAVLTECAARLEPDTVIVQSSTIGPEGMATVAALGRSHGWKLLDAPVLGTKSPAERGLLVVLAAGDPALRPTVEPVFDAVGSRTVWAGDELGQASALKLACNAWVASLTAAAAQSLALAAGAGLDPHLVLDAIKGGGTDSPYLHAKGQAMIEGNYQASFSLDGVRKDLDLIASAAVGSGVNHELLDALRSVFAAAGRKGHGQDDMAAVFTAF